MLEAVSEVCSNYVNRGYRYIFTTNHGAISEGRNKPDSKAYKYYVTIIHQIYKRRHTSVVHRR